MKDFMEQLKIEAEVKSHHWVDQVLENGRGKHDLISDGAIARHCRKIQIFRTMPRKVAIGYWNVISSYTI